MKEEVVYSTKTAESGGNGSNHRAKWTQWAHKLDTFGVETRGIERVSPQERQFLASQKSHSKARQFAHVLGLWFAACGGLTSMSSFFLPTLVFGLNLKDSLVSGLISMIIGCLVPAYCSTMGPKSGCRQMVSARFVFGQWGVKFVALLCVVGLVGWSIVNCVLGGEVLAAISGVGLEVGIVVISVVSLVVSIFGIKILLKFQTIFAIPITIANILFYIVVFKKREYLGNSNDLVVEQEYSSLTTRGNWLSFFTIGFSITASWGGGASDYYILFPENTPSWQVFTVTFLGIAVPSTFVAIIGTVCGAIAYGFDPWSQVYTASGVGGLIAESFKPWGNFGKFVVVLLYISLICNNIMNTYSAAFDFQLIDQKLAVIPRWVYAIGITVVYLVLSLVGKDHFSTIISNFLPMLGYWISIYIVILLEENLIFRSRWMRPLHYREFLDDLDESPDDAREETDGEVAGHLDSDESRSSTRPTYLYNWTQWNQPRFITYGLAAMGSFAIGAVGAVLGMNQVYWQGPLAGLLGDYGGDIGFFLCAGFSGVSYGLLRGLELHFYGK